MEKALYDWFMNKRADNVPISSEILIKKAQMLHSRIKEHPGEFRGSCGWITNFKKRHGIRVLKITGEKYSNAPESVPPFLSKFENKVREKDLKPEQIYNADESGLFWKLLPAKTMVHFKERSAPGRKTSKQRITFLACTNATGCHKLKPLVIGKAKKPRAFKNFGSIPVVYKANRNAWMTLVMFEEWLQNNFVPESTENFPDKDIILKELEKHGGICDCQSSRDTFIYAASAEGRGIAPVTKLLADVTLRPKLTEEEVHVARQVVNFELESLGMRPEQEPILMDMIHAAGYRENTLGLPKICPQENINTIDRNTLLTYLKHHHAPERMVVAGVGVNHDDLVKQVEKYFVSKNPIWETEKILGKGADSVDKSISQYTGGLKTEECEIPIYAATGLPELAHVVIGLEGCSHQDPDFVASCVLNIMMGGGGSFSAGGPGKGMYTRLYTNVLNRYHWMYSATAYNHAYADSGLFCIHASAPPSNVREMCDVITRELVTMATSPGVQELRRAKTQLQSMLLMNLEARPVVFEDIGRQVLAIGSRKRPEYFIQEIEKITAEDIQRIAKRILSSPPAVAARGEIRGLPDLKDIQTALMHSDGRLPSNKRLSLFR